MKKLYKLTYRCGWHSETLPLLTSIFVFAEDVVDAINKLTRVKNIHCDNVVESRAVEYIE